MVFLELRRDSRVTTGNSGCLLCWPRLEQIAGVEVLFHEATYTEKDVDKCKKHTHSTAKQAAQIAKLAGAGKLIIGHFSAREDDHTVFLDEAKEVFENTVLAVEKETIDI